MKRLFQILFIGILAGFIVVSCSSDKVKEQGLNDIKPVDSFSIVDTNSTGINLPIIDSTELVKDKSEFEPKEPIKAQEVLDEQERIARSGPFYNLGCCKTKEERVKACCCDAVLKKFARMYEEEQEKLSTISSTDPILNGCKKLKAYKAKFDAIENPPKAEDDLDDLF